MRKGILGLLVAASVFSLIAGCGGGGSTTASNNNTGSNNPGVTPVIMKGVVATGSPVSLTGITMTDANGKTVTGTTDANGNYSIDVAGLAFPLLAKVTYASSTGTATVLYSYAQAPGTANVNPLTSAAVIACTGSFVGTFDTAAQTAIKTNLAAKIAALQAKLAQFGAGTDNPITAAYTIGAGLDKVFDLIALDVDTTGKLSIKTKYDGAVIASSQVGDLTNINIPENLIPVEDNVTIHVTNMNVTSGEVGSNLLLTMTGINGVDEAKNNVLIGGMRADSHIMYDGTGAVVGLDVVIPPGCPGGSVAVVVKPINGPPKVGYAPSNFTVTKQHDYALGSVKVFPTIIMLMGNFPTSGTVQVTLTQGTAAPVMLTVDSYSQAMMFTIPMPINVLQPFTVQVTSMDGKKSSNIRYVTP